MAASYDQGAFWLIVGHRRKQVTSIEGAQNTPAEARIGGNVRNPTVLRARQLTKSVDQHLLSHATNARDAREVIGCAGTVVERFLELIKNLLAPYKLGGGSALGWLRWVRASHAVLNQNVCKASRT